MAPEKGPYVVTATAPLAASGPTRFTALQAEAAVLDGAGAGPRRDAVDRRIVAGVRDRSGRLIDSQTDVGGWPVPAPASAPLDSVKSSTAPHDEQIRWW